MVPTKHLLAVQLAYKYFEREILPFIADRDGWDRDRVPILDVTYRAPPSAFDPEGIEDVFPCGEIVIKYVWYDKHNPPTTVPQRSTWAYYLNQVKPDFDQRLWPGPCRFHWHHGISYVIEHSNDYEPTTPYDQWTIMSHFIY